MTKDNCSQSVSSHVLEMAEESVKGRYPNVDIADGRREGSQRLHSLGDFFDAQKLFVCLKVVPKQTCCSLLASDMLDIENNYGLKPAALSPQ